MAHLLNLLAPYPGPVELKRDFIRTNLPLWEQEAAAAGKTGTREGPEIKRLCIRWWRAACRRQGWRREKKRPEKREGGEPAQVLEMFEREGKG